MPNPFPLIAREMIKFGGEDRNPAVQLFGRRFFADQTVTELLVELLLVAVSEKRVGKDTFKSTLPSVDLLCDWPADEKNPKISSTLKYAPKARLNLKLFSFLGAPS